ncbi:MAG: hypothetical protein ACEQSR_01400 [Candidatus Methylacidiphilales bacterium]
MGLIDNAKTFIKREVLSRIDDQVIMVEAALRRGTDQPSKMLNYEAQEVAAKTLKDWKTAISLATDPVNPDRTELANLHDNLLLDDDLVSVIETRIGFVQQNPIKFIDEKGAENPEVSKIFERPWFNDLIYKVLFSQFKGTTVLEFYELNANMELEEVPEIPQSHFNAKKGIITKNSGDQTGWLYKEGEFANQYLQVGRDDSLGMLTYVAPIVLSKKLGMGALLDYVDKFGVPPIFITTDREDDNRIKQLFTAAANFKRNHFMVGRGSEKFEIGNIGGTGVAPHEKLIEICNNRISKRILGGSGIADEKAFVGSAKIQKDLATIRFEADKLFFKYTFNAKIKPILLNLSPVYAPLATLNLEWDNTENLSTTEIIDMVVKLSQFYDIDPEYITKVTGLPIIGVKDNAQPLPPTGGGGAKK